MVASEVKGMCALRGGCAFDWVAVSVESECGVSVGVLKFPKGAPNSKGCIDSQFDSAEACALAV